MPSTESKLLQAGANRVVLPTHIGAERIAELILYPQADGCCRAVRRRKASPANCAASGWSWTWSPVAEGSGCVGRTVRAIEQEAAGAFMIVALNRRDGTSKSPPDGASVVRAGDGVVVVGHPGRAQMMAGLFRTKWQRSAR